MTSGYTRAANDLMGEVDRMDDLATPRPWKLVISDDVIEITNKNRRKNSIGEIAVVSIGYDEPFETEQRESAALIVKAVNAYDSICSEFQNIREIIADKTYPDDATRLADIAACAERALEGASK